MNRIFPPWRSTMPWAIFVIASTSVAPGGGKRNIASYLPAAAGASDFLNFVVVVFFLRSAMIHAPSMGLISTSLTASYSFSRCIRVELVHRGFDSSIDPRHDRTCCSCDRRIDQLPLLGT